MKPNLLFIQVDQLAAQFLRCYGDKIAHTPNLDDEDLAGTAEQKTSEDRLYTLVMKRWDSAALIQQIRPSQIRRQLVLESDMMGLRPRWNHDEDPGAHVVWFRGETSYNEWTFKCLPLENVV